MCENFYFTTLLHHDFYFLTRECFITVCAVAYDKWRINIRLIVFGFSK